jgi:hypothetical protein
MLSRAPHLGQVPPSRQPVRPSRVAPKDETRRDETVQAPPLAVPSHLSVVCRVCLEDLAVVPRAHSPHLISWHSGCCAVTPSSAAAFSLLSRRASPR